jgi:ApeA N-terminal domain 1
MMFAVPSRFGTLPMTLSQKWVGKFALNKDEGIGELTYDPEKGISLVLRFTPAPKNWSGSFRAYPVIKGMLHGDQPCTLIGAFDRALNNSSGEHVQHIGAEALLLHAACDSADEPIFTRMSFTSPALTAFYEPRGIKIKYPKKLHLTYTASYRRPKPLKSKWRKNRTLLTAHAHLPWHQARDGSFPFTETAWYEIAFHPPVSTTDVLRHLSAIEFFLGIAVGQFAGAPLVHLLTDPMDRTRPLARLFRSRQWYRPFNLETYKPTQVSVKELGAHTMSLLSRWFELYDRIERITDVYRASQHIPGIESRFLFIVQALEGLHRICLSGPAIKPEEFHRGLDAILTAIPEDLSSEAKQFFQSRLQLFNQPNSSNRRPLCLQGELADITL